MPDGGAELKIFLKLKDEASKQLEKVQGNLDGMSKRMRVLGGIAFGAGLAVGGMAIKSAMTMGKMFTLANRRKKIP
jgi:hypothetical protein